VFHALGILIGLALRNGFCPIVHFPSLIYSILANEVSLESSAFFPHLLSSIVSKEQMKEKEQGREGEREEETKKSSSLQKEYENYQKEMKVLSSLKIVHSIGLVVRFGIVSIFPEVCVSFSFLIYFRRSNCLLSSQTSFDLWSKPELQSLFSGGHPFLPLTAMKLYQITDYDERILSSSDRLFIHVSLFFSLFPIAIDRSNMIVFSLLLFV
jgi:hypothetical protein